MTKKMNIHPHNDLSNKLQSGRLNSGRAALTSAKQIYLNKSRYVSGMYSMKNIFNEQFGKFRPTFS